MFGKFEIKADQKLEFSKLMRAGKTASSWTNENSEIKILHKPGKRSVEIMTSMPSKGGGTTDILIKIGANDFGVILYAMLMASPKIFVDQFVKFSSVIKSLICAKTFVEKDWEGKLRVDDTYDDLIETIDNNIKSNVVLFEALGLAAKKTTPTKTVKA